MQSDVNFPLVLCKPTSQIIQPKFNQCKRFVLHPHFPFIYLTISILGSSTIFGLSLKYTLRFVPSTILKFHIKYIDSLSLANFTNHKNTYLIESIHRQQHHNTSKQIWWSYDSSNNTYQNKSMSTILLHELSF